MRAITWLQTVPFETADAHVITATPVLQYASLNLMGLASNGMADELGCKNCIHSKNDHKLVLGRHGGGDFLPGTSMPSGKLDSKILCTKCPCKGYESKEDSE